MDPTTTPAADQDEQALGTQPAQPDEQPAEAVTPPSEQPPTEPEPSEPEVPDNSDEEPEQEEYTPEWLKSKGIDPEDPKAFEKVAKMAFNSEKRMTRSRQQASELQNQMAAQPLETRSEDPMVQEALSRAAAAETTVMVSEWKARNGITAEQDERIGEYIKANPDKGFLLKNGYLSLDDVFAMSGVGKQDTAALEAKGGQKALETLANKQRASAVSGRAASPSPATPEVDPIMEVLRGND